MPSIEHVLTTCTNQVPKYYLQRAYKLHQRLCDGAHYAALNGVRIKHNPELIRFKIGREWRLLYRKIDNGLIPYCLVSRQNFDRKLKRR